MNKKRIVILSLGLLLSTSLSLPLFSQVYASDASPVEETQLKKSILQKSLENYRSVALDSPDTTTHLSVGQHKIPNLVTLTREFRHRFKDQKDLDPLAQHTASLTKDLLLQAVESNIFALDGAMDKLATSLNLAENDKLDPVQKALSKLEAFYTYGLMGPLYIKAVNKKAAKHDETKLNKENDNKKTIQLKEEKKKKDIEDSNTQNQKAKDHIKSTIENLFPGADKEKISLYLFDSKGSLNEIGLKEQTSVGLLNSLKEQVKKLDQDKDTKIKSIEKTFTDEVTKINSEFDALYNEKTGSLVLEINQFQSNYKMIFQASSEKSFLGKLFGSTSHRGTMEVHQPFLSQLTDDEYIEITNGFKTNFNVKLNARTDISSSDKEELANLLKLETIHKTSLMTSAIVSEDYETSQTPRETSSKPEGDEKKNLTSDIQIDDGSGIGLRKETQAQAEAPFSSQEGTNPSLNDQEMEKKTSSRVTGTAQPPKNSNGSVTTGDPQSTHSSQKPEPIVMNRSGEIVPEEQSHIPLEVVKGLGGQAETVTPTTFDESKGGESGGEEGDTENEVKIEVPANTPESATPPSDNKGGVMQVLSNFFGLMAELKSF